jgi:hypothetical protein
MSCLTGIGRKLACKSNWGGVKEFYILEYVEGLLGLATISNDEITALSASQDVWKFEVRGAVILDEAQEVSRENNTTFYTQTFTAPLMKQDKASRSLFAGLSKSNAHIIVKDNNGAYRLLGAVDGLDIAVNTSTGDSLGAANGYILTATGVEKESAPYIAASAIGVAQDFDVQSTTIEP